MKKTIALLLFAALSLAIVTSTAADVIGTLGYSLSTTTVNLDNAGNGSFSITIPEPPSPYAGVQFEVQMPPYASIEASYSLAGMAIGPQRYNGADPIMENTYAFAIFSTENTFTEELTCTVKISCPGPGVKTITIKRIRQYWINGYHTDELESDGPANITVIPFGDNVSGDANLSSLTITSGTLMPTFNPSVTNYTAAVNNNVDSISVIATSNNPRATVTGTGLARLNVGANTITVTVTAEDGVATKEYSIIVTRESGGVETNVTFAVSTAYARPGQTVTVDISVADNPGIKTASLNLAYDSSKLELAPDGAVVAVAGTAQYYDNQSGSVGISWIAGGGSDLFAGDGKLFTVTFKAKEGFLQGSAPLTLTGSATDMFETLEAAFQGGAVAIVAGRAGDVNGDGAVDAFDAIMVQSIWMDGAIYTKEGPRDYSAAEWFAADINEDGSVDAIDLVLILLYLAGDPSVPL